MANVCAVCGKGTTAGRSIKRRGKAKKDGGVGKNITGISRRTFKPNLQMVRASIHGQIKRMNVCVKCIKAGKVLKGTKQQERKTQDTAHSS